MWVLSCGDGLVRTFGACRPGRLTDAGAAAESVLIDTGLPAQIERCTPAGAAGRRPLSVEPDDRPRPRALRGEEHGPDAAGRSFDSVGIIELLCISYKLNHRGIVDPASSGRLDARVAVRFAMKQDESIG
ncbi:hypothetical protein GCM10018966_095220 [Streptomyces yanii]